MYPTSDLTEKLARIVSRELGYSINIDTFDMKGNNKAFKEWLATFEMGFISDALNGWLTNNITTYITKCGEEAIAYWYPCDLLVIGVTVNGATWIIPGDEVCQLVEDYGR